MRVKLPGFLHPEPAYPEQPHIDRSYQKLYDTIQMLVRVLVVSVVVNLGFGWMAFKALREGSPRPTLWQVDSGMHVKRIDVSETTDWPMAPDHERKNFIRRFVHKWRTLSLDRAELDEIGHYLERRASPVAHKACVAEFLENHPIKLMNDGFRRRVEVLSVTPTTPGNTRHYLVDWAEHLEHASAQNKRTVQRRARVELEQIPYQKEDIHTYESPMGLRIETLELIDLGGTK